jgi:hypothetical protein
MARPNTLPFQYGLRGQQLQYLDGDAHALAVEQRDSELEDYLGGVVAWRAFPFAVGWKNYSGMQPVQYRKINDLVYLRGHGRMDTALGTPTSTVGILPAGFRPPIVVVMAIPMGDPATVWRMDIGTGGNVTPYIAPVNNNWASFDGICFSVTP